MSEGNTGTVEFVGDPNTICNEAAFYTVLNEDGERVRADVLQKGYRVTDIPQDQLVRWLVNQNFVAVDAEAEKAQEELQYDVAKRINGTLVNQEAAREALRQRNRPLEDLKKDELLSRAEQAGVDVDSSNTKAEIISALRGDAEGESTVDPSETTKSVGPPPESGSIGAETSGEEND